MMVWYQPLRKHKASYKDQRDLCAVIWLASLLTPFQGLQWCPLSEDEIIPRIRAMEGRRGRPPNSERQHAAGDVECSGARRRKGRPPNVGHTEFPSASEAKLLRKLEAQGNTDTPHPLSTTNYQSETPHVIAKHSSTHLLFCCFRNRPAGRSNEADEEAGEAGTCTSCQGSSQTARYTSNTNHTKYWHP